MAIIQLRVDDELKEQASLIYGKLGLDLSTAIRMFLTRSVSINGIPFEMVLDKEPYDASEAMRIKQELQKISLERKNNEMTLDEINEEIRLTRLERKKKT